MAFTKTQAFVYTRSAEDLNGDTSRVALLDADGDGDLDAIVGSFFWPAEDRSHPLLVLLNDGAGGLTDGTEALFGTTIPEVNNPVGILVGDFDGDERDDVFIANTGIDADLFPGAHNALYLSASGEGFVDASDTLPDVSDWTHSAAQGDIDGDGDIDIVVMNLNGGTPPSGALTDCYVLLNDGAGAFTRTDDLLPPDIEVREYGKKFTTSLLFDADGDDDPDLFLGASGEPTEEHSLLLINDGSGDFSAAERRQLPGAVLGDVGVNVLDAVAADLDGNGALDLVLARSLNYHGSHIQILMNDGTGIFADQTATRLPQVFDESENYSSGISVADMNGDSFLDIVALHNVHPPIFLNDGTGHFVNLPHTGFDYSGVEGSPEWVRLMPVDANNDGRMDLLAIDHVPHHPTDNFWYYLQQDPGLAITGTAAADGLMGDADAETLTGLAGADVMFGAAGNDTLLGGAGADHLDAGEGADRLVGGDGDDTLAGFRGADTLVGGPGADRLRGGAGNDLYLARGGDLVRELPAQGIDTVQSRGSWTLGPNLERLELAGPGAADGTGNALANTLTGNAAANTLRGAGGNDSLHGAGGVDRLLGESGADALSGDVGADTLAGGAGNDTLTGGAGADVFVLDGTLRAGGVDVLADFVAGVDRLELSATRFATLAPGALPPEQFAGGSGITGGADPDDRIVHDRASGMLYYDPDGVGGEPSVAIARLAPAVLLSAADILVG